MPIILGNGLSPIHYQVRVMIKLTFLHLGRHLLHKQISIVFLRSCSHVNSMFAISFVYWFQRWFSYLWFCWRKYENNYVYTVATLNFSLFLLTGERPAFDSVWCQLFMTVFEIFMSFLASWLDTHQILHAPLGRNQLYGWWAVRHPWLLLQHFRTFKECSYVFKL